MTNAEEKAKLKALGYLIRMTGQPNFKHRLEVLNAFDIMIEQLKRDKQQSLRQQAEEYIGIIDKRINRLKEDDNKGNILKMDKDRKKHSAFKQLKGRILELERLKELFEEKGGEE